MRGISDRIAMSEMSIEVRDDPMWTSARLEIAFVNIYYAMFFSMDIVFAQFVRNRFLYLRKEAKTAQHNAGKQILQKLKQKKNIRLRQKEMYYGKSISSKNRQNILCSVSVFLIPFELERESRRKTTNPTLSGL